MKKRILSLFLVTALLCALLLQLSLPAKAADASGTCGENLTWSFDKNTGKLTITGRGEMDNWSYTASPWFSINLLIKSVSLPNGLTNIGDLAFIECSSLTSVTIPNSVTRIGEAAFVACSSLSRVTIPDNVTSIGSEAFMLCTSLTDVTIPGNVTNIGSHPFASCSSLTAINVASANSGYSSVDGVLFEKQTNALIQYPCGRSGSYQIPDGVTSIGDFAFSGCTGLTTVMIPDGVTNIGHSAFSDCTGLTSVSIPDGVTNIGNSAFSGCTSLTSVTIPNGVPSINGETFYHCTSLTSVTIPDSVTSIGNYAFDNCSALTDCAIPDSVASIGVYAFRGCASLQSVAIPNSMTSINGSVFSGCKSLTSVTIPDSVTSIESYAFSGCASLTSVTIPNSVTSINPSVFSGCTSLTSVTIPDSVTSIESYAFSGCASLTSVTIPDSVTSIESYAFSGCTSLTRMTIPDNVTNIGENVFQKCDKLSMVKILNPECSIYPSNATLGYASTAIIYSLSGTTAQDYAENYSYTFVAFDVPNPATGSCGDKLTWSLNRDTGELEISGTGPMDDWHLTQYYYDPPPWYVYREEIKTVSILDSVTNIGAYAFNDCTGLTSVTIPDSVTSIGYSAFSGDRSLTGISLSNNVKSINSYAFNDCSGLTTVTIPASVTTIGDCVFKGCGNLTAINVEPGNRYYYSDSGVLYYHRENELVQCPGGRSEPYQIPENVTYIYHYAFYGCSNLTSVTIPDSVKIIGDNAFNNCTSLTSMTIPDSVTDIDNSAFSGCNSLTSVTLPNNLKRIGISAFSGCTSLTSITIRDGVRFIGRYAFSGCTGLTSITILSPWFTFDPYIGYDYTYEDSLGNASFTTIYGRPGSTAQWYAEKYGFSFVELDVPAIPVSGKCGTDTSWTLNRSTGEMKIFGTGRMDDTRYEYPVSPWEEYRSEIKNVTISEGVTYIGLSTFYRCDNLMSVTILNPNCFIASTSYQQSDLDYETLGKASTTTIYGYPGSTAEEYARKKGHKFVEIFGPTQFTDIPAGAYYAEPVAWAIENGITNGTSPTTFSPDSTCTRAQVVTFLWRAAGEPEPKTKVNPFIDVKSDAYYYNAILWAVENRITTGTSSNTFSPNAGCTRGQVVTFLWRAANQPEPASANNPFSDVVPDTYYYKAVLWAVEQGITKGTSTDTFSPDSTCSRGQIVTFLYRDLQGK